SRRKSTGWHWHPVNVEVRRSGLAIGETEHEAPRALAAVQCHGWTEAPAPAWPADTPNCTGLLTGTAMPSEVPF
ncbi:MAG: hypothetical protein WCQ91_08685, partial [Planctomycetota bacterium]